MRRNTIRGPLARAIIAALVTLILAFGGTIAARRLVAPDDREQAHSLVETARAELARGDRPAAVLAIERARLLAPRAAAVRDARRAADISDPESRIVRGMRIVSANEWALVAIVSGWAAALALTFVMLGRRRPAASGVAVGALALFGIASAGVAIPALSTPEVVAAGGASALVAPYESAAVNVPLAAGTIVLRGEAHRGFVKVAAADGAHGWVRASALVPTSAPRGRS